ncbi:MAG: carboxyl transferase domain-containing protein [Nocardioidaceae bacterium]
MTNVLVANRGEIAVRVIRAARGLGLRSVAVFEPDDRRALHVDLADEAHPLSGDRPYLDVDQLVDVAARADCELLHPGYGFLSESPDLADACAKSGITFVGPSRDALAVLGDKGRARAVAQESGMPVLPATSTGATLDEAVAFFSGRAGHGVVVKASAGGGGRGMRVVTAVEELPGAYERCASEALRAFGSGDLYVEELLRRARHIEVQLVGDGTGAVAHVWDRDCSVQRRHQKVVEVAPCLTVPGDVRQRLLDGAVHLGSRLRYLGLGTIEFLVDADDPGRWYFLEANPRVQVEHTVTEEVTGIDLVRAQLQIALGRSLADLGLTQDEIPAPRAVAVQARVAMETTTATGATFPSTGTITELALPSGPHTRVDTHARAGLVADGRYDSLLAKVIVTESGSSLAEAARNAGAALSEIRVGGVETNVALLRNILAHPTFTRGEATTRFLDDHLAELVPAVEEQDVLPDELAAPFAGTVVALPAEVGQHLAIGAPAVVLESMKMEHVVTSTASGVVRTISVRVGDTVQASQPLLTMELDDEQIVHAAEEADVDLDELRDDLADVVARHLPGLDESRPEAVAKRRRTGQRTARENIADLCDEGTFLEYGALALAAQRSRRTLDDLIANTPADGMVTGVGRVNGAHFGDRAQCAVLAYDYTVLAGTQGHINHKKTDRMIELAERQRLPLVLFGEGGGGRPGDTDTFGASWLDVPTFAKFGRLSGRVPTVAVVSGRCFAGNAALVGSCDVIIATRNASIGMGGPAMIEGGGLGTFAPDEVGPTSVQVPNGVIDVLVDDEAEAVAVAKRYLSYFQGNLPAGDVPDQRLLRRAVPESRVRPYFVRDVVQTLADAESVLELRPEFGRSIITALARIDGRAVGVFANDPRHLGGAIDADSADKLARFLHLCDGHGLPLVSLCDTPGFMVGPDAERTATVRHFSRLFVAGAHLRVPLVAVVLRKAYGLGAQAMVGGCLTSPDAIVAWPTGELGPMGLEGAVRLGFRKELEAAATDEAREALFEELLAEQYARGKAMNAAVVFELDDVIDPVDTRAWISQTFATASPPEPRTQGFIDTW